MSQGNNSAPLAVLTSLDHYGRSHYGDITLVLSPFWVEQVHEDYHGLDWGQGVSALPYKAREIFESLYPEHPRGQKIQWSQLMGLRQEIIKRLQEKDIQLVLGVPQPLEESAKGWEMTIETGEGSKRLAFASNIHVYNSHRVPREGDLYAGAPLMRTGEAIPYTDLYRFAKTKVPPAIIFGSGLSAQWARRDFSGQPVVIVAHSALPDNELTREIRSDVPVYLQEDLCIQKKPGAPGVFQLLSHKGELLFEGMAVCATGFRHATELTQALPDLDHRDIDAPMPKGSKEILVAPEVEQWVAAQDSPVGGLAEAVQWWMGRTGNFELLDFSGFHSAMFVEQMNDYMAARGVVLAPCFYERVQAKLSAMVFTPSQQEIIAILLEAYHQSNPRDPSAQFEKYLRQFPALRSASQDVALSPAP